MSGGGGLRWIDGISLITWQVWIRVFWLSMGVNWEVIMEWSDKFEDSYSRYRGEGFLSPSLSIRNAMKKFPDQTSFEYSSLLFSFRRTNGGKRWWWVHDVCDGRMMRCPWRQTTFDSGNIHACLVPCKWCKDPRGRNCLRFKLRIDNCETSHLARHRSSANRTHA